MKILHINTSDAGGAAGSCMRLHLGLLGQGIQSKVLVMQLVKRNVPECHLFHRPASRASLGRRIASKSVRLLRETGFLSDVPPDEQEQRRQAAFIAARPPGLEFFSYPYSNCDLTELELYHEADIVNLHWVAGFLDWPS